MENVYFIPNWFFAYSIILEIAFAFITAFVAIYAFKIYNLCKQREFRIFGIGFTFISISYIIWSLVNLFLLDRISEGVQALTLQEFVSTGVLGIYLYMFLTLIGLATLAYISLKENNMKMYSLLIIVTIIALAFSSGKTLIFHLISSIFILFLIMHYSSQYLEHKKAINLMIPIAFVLLLASHISFIFSIHNYTYYVCGHITELAAYSLILARLLFIIKKSKAPNTVKIKRKN